MNFGGLRLQVPEPVFKAIRSELLAAAAHTDDWLTLPLPE